MKSIVRQLRPSGYARLAQGLAYGLLAFFLSSNAWARSPIAPSITMEGTFSEPHEMAALAYEEAACLADNAKFRDGICIFNVSDEVRVSRKNGKFEIGVDVISTNFHQCTFEASAKRRGNTLIAREKAQRYNGEKVEDVICVVKVKFTGRDTVSVSNNGMCEEFCGANVSLDIEKAIRQDKN